MAGYGNVWTPAGVASDWAPYRYGHWVWVEPWGWTWVEDEPWGFAPFHYGRWAYAQHSWCWVPGPVVVRPVYSPALVAFVGGGGFHVGRWRRRWPGGLVPARSWRSVYAAVSRQPQVRRQRERHQHTRVNITQVTNVYNHRTPTSHASPTSTNGRKADRGVALTRLSTRARFPATWCEWTREKSDKRRWCIRLVFSRNAPAFKDLGRPAADAASGASDGAPGGGDSRSNSFAAYVRAAAGSSQRSYRGSGRPEPARGPNEAQRPQPPAQANQNRGNENQRPQQPVARENENSRPTQQPAQPANNQRPADMRPVPRPPQSERVQINPQNEERPQAQSEPRPAQNQARPDQNQGRPEQGHPEQNAVRPQLQEQPVQRPQPAEAARPAQPQNGKPLVRQAPRVQDRPQQQQNEEQKFRQWQDQRQRASQPQAPSARTASGEAAGAASATTAGAAFRPQADRAREENEDKPRGRGR